MEHLFSFLLFLATPHDGIIPSECTFCESSHETLGWGNFSLFMDLLYTITMSG